MGVIAADASQYLVFRPERSESPGADFLNQGKLRRGGGIETRILGSRGTRVTERGNKHLHCQTVSSVFVFGCGACFGACVIPHAVDRLP